MPRQRTFRIDIDQVDNAAARLRQRCGGGLGEKKRRARIACEQFVPLRRRDAADRCRLERRGIVDQRIEAPKTFQRCVDQVRQHFHIAQISLQYQHAIRPLQLEFLCEVVEFCTRATAMQGKIVAGGVQTARNLRTYAPG